MNMNMNMKVHGDLITLEPVEETCRPRTLRVLSILADAGDAGLIITDIVENFTEPVDWQRRITQVNQILRWLRRSDKVRRSVGKEPSPRYHNVPAHRWFITDNGREYLAIGGWDGVRSANRHKVDELIKQREQHRLNRELLLKAAPALVQQLPTGCTTARLKLITELYDRGLFLEEIGQLFDITRERIRQIYSGINTKPCQCQSCQ